MPGADRSGRDDRTRPTAKMKAFRVPKSAVVPIRRLTTKVGRNVDLVAATIAISGGKRTLERRKMVCRVNRIYRRNPATPRRAQSTGWAHTAGARRSRNGPGPRRGRCPPAPLPWTAGEAPLFVVLFKYLKVKFLLPSDTAVRNQLTRIFAELHGKVVRELHVSLNDCPNLSH